MWITLRVKEAPKRGSFFAPEAQVVSDGPFFSVLPEKNGEKRGAGERKRAYAPEKACRSILRYVVSFPSSKRPSGGPQNFCCLKFCCGKYLCLQNRKVFALNLCRAFRFCPFLIRSFYWLRKRNEPSKKTKGQRLRSEERR